MVDIPSRYTVQPNTKHKYWCSGEFQYLWSDNINIPRRPNTSHRTIVSEKNANQATSVPYPVVFLI